MSEWRVSESRGGGWGGGWALPICRVIHIVESGTCFRGSGDFMHVCICICVRECAIISTCIRVLINKERLEQNEMLAVKMFLSARLAAPLCVYVMILIRVDFSAIAVPVIWIKIDVVLTEKKYPIHDLWLSLSVGAHRHKLCKIRGAMEHGSGWCFLYMYQITWLQVPPWRGAAVHNGAPGVAPIHNHSWPNHI